MGLNNATRRPLERVLMPLGGVLIGFWYLGIGWTKVLLIINDLWNIGLKTGPYRGSFFYILYNVLRGNGLGVIDLGCRGGKGGCA